MKKQKWILPFDRVDGLSVCLLTCFLLLLLLGGIFQSIWLLLFGLPFAVFCIFRLVSPNRPARKKENAAFLSLLGRKSRRAKQKDKNICTCPDCGARLGVEKKTGHFTVTCPRCNTRFSAHFDENFQ